MKDLGEILARGQLLYAVLLSYAWQQGSCFPGYGRLQHDLGCGINQVTRYLRELEGAGLITRRRRGLGKTTIYTLHDPPTPPAGAPAGAPVSQEPSLFHQIGETGLTETVKAVSPVRRHKQDSGEEDPAEHHPAPVVRRPVPPPPTPLAPIAPPAGERSGASDDVLDLLISQGVTQRIAHVLVAKHPAETIRQQVSWQAYRPAAKSPAGALVQAIRDAWPPPSAWVEAQEHAATVARHAEEEASRQAEAEARRREWAAKPPEERIAGRLQFWLAGRRAKRQEPTAEEIAAKRAELLAQLTGPAPLPGAASPGAPVGVAYATPGR